MLRCGQLRTPAHTHTWGEAKALGQKVSKYLGDRIAYIPALSPTTVTSI